MRIWNMSIGIGGMALVATVSIALAQGYLISGDRIKAHVRYLSSDLLEGRGVGTRGGQLTEEYLAAQLAAFGAKPAGENKTYFHKVPLVGVQTLPGSKFAIAKDGKTIDLQWQDEYVGATHRQQPEVSFEADAVFVGHGIVNKQEEWD